jgi:hypothetical protein
LLWRHCQYLHIPRTPKTGHSCIRNYSTSFKCSAKFNLKNQCNTRLTFPTPVTRWPLGSGRGITTFTKLPDERQFCLDE